MTIQFRIGHVKATLVQEMVDRSFDFMTFFPKATREVLQANLDWLSPGHYDPATGKILLSMHAWLLDTGTHKILIDGCVGNDKDRPGRPAWCGLNTPFLERLRQAGAHPEDIDFVLCTHLHADHVGWNTRLIDGRWVPTFPNAKYVFSRREHAHWEALLAENAGGPHLLSYQDSVLPVVAAGQALIVDDGFELLDCLTLEPAPGHTPGHVAIWLSAGQDSAVMTGDILHHPIQIKYPRWSTIGCRAPELAADTRERLLCDCIARDALLMPGHFMAPHALRGSALAALAADPDL